MSDHPVFQTIPAASCLFCDSPTGNTGGEFSGLNFNKFLIRAAKVKET